MAVVISKSTYIGNRDATPKVLTDSFILGGTSAEGYGFVTAAVGDSVGSAYKLISIPSNSRMSSFRYASEALGAGVTIAAAAWYPTVLQQGGGNFLPASSAGALITSTGIAPAASVSTASTTFQDLMAIATLSIAQQEMPLWQMLGLPSDPEVNIDLGFLIGGAAVGTAGRVGLKVFYMY